MAVSSPTEPVRPEPPRLRTVGLWTLAGLCAAGPLALGLLNVLGAGTGMLINVVTVLTGVLGFVFAVYKALTEELSHGSPKARTMFVGLAVIGSAILLVAGLATRTIAPMARLSGTADVAVVDLRSPTKDQQPEFDDLAVALSSRIHTTEGSQVRSYAAEVDAPIEELARPTEPNGLRTWTRDFMAATDAELVIGGIAENRTGGQLLLRLFVYLPVELLPEAEELTGWYPLGTYRADRSMSSGRARQQLLDQVAAQFAPLSAFVRGLDTWHAGYAGEAVADFAEVVDAEVVDGAGRPGSLADLGRLFRGHAYESQATSLSGTARQRLLDSARRDYGRIQRDTPLTARADVSLAMNAYQTKASAGCAKGRIDRARLRGPIETLNRIAADPSVRELIRSKARVNQAQVESCLLVAGDPAAAASLDAHVTELLAPRLQPQDADLEVKRHVRGLALSIRAISEAAHGQRSRAVATLELALAHDGRAHRQLVWYSMQSSWLLKDCKIAEAGTAHQRAEEQFAAAVAAQRQSAAEVRRLSANYQRKLADAIRTCR